MRWIGVAVIAIAAQACRLQPGETRCTTTMVYGTAFTKCRSRPSEPSPDPPAPPARAPAPSPQLAMPPAPAPSARWWCAEGSQPGETWGLCFLDRGECERLRADDLAGTSLCRLRGPVSCFGIELPGLTTNSCHPSFAACNDQRDFVIEHPEQATATTMCRVVE